MFGLTQLGVIHTAISLIAVAAGLIALLRDREISPRNTLGKVYVITTVLVCLTGFGIFQHGGFGKPHVLGIITLIVLGIAYVQVTPSSTAVFVLHRDGQLLGDLPLPPDSRDHRDHDPVAPGSAFAAERDAPALQAASAVLASCSWSARPSRCGACVPGSGRLSQVRRASYGRAPEVASGVARLDTLTARRADSTCAYFGSHVPVRS